jgi:tetratricopeptide (TPR) repeat protein
LKTTVVWRAGAVLLVAAATCRAVSAADVPAADARYEAALDRMLADIADPQRSFDFVKEATAVGDLRGAIAALERMLLLNPSLANIQLELGVLYLRLGNQEVGRYHIENALRAPNVPAVVRERAEALLASSGGRSSGAKRSSFTGQVALNLHYDNNANAAPSSPGVFGHDPFTGQDLIFELSRQSLKKSDGFLDFNLGLTHNYVLGGTDSVLETNALVYTSKYNDLSNLNFTVGSLDIGPVLRVGGSIDAPISLRPYAVVTYDLLDSTHYLTAYGGGLELRAQATAQTYGFAKVEYTRQEFKNSADRFVTDRTGNYVTADTGLVHQFGRALQVSANLSASRASADTNYQTYTRYGGGFGGKYFFALSGNGPPWAVGLSAQVRKSDYDRPDPQVNTTIARNDTRYDAVLTLDIPVTRTILLSVRGNYTNNDSSIPNYTFHDTGGSIGASWRF